MITTRQATSDDAFDFRTVINAAFATLRDVYRPKPDAVPTSENEALEVETTVALLNEEIVGAMSTYQDGSAFNVSQLAVIPRFHQRGIARALLQSAHEAAIHHGARYLRLNTIQETGNVAIFERLGFTVDKTSEATWCVSDRHPKLTDVSMIRSLNIVSPTDNQPDSKQDSKCR